MRVPRFALGLLAVFVSACGSSGGAGDGTATLSGRLILPAAAPLRAVSLRVDPSGRGVLGGAGAAAPTVDAEPNNNAACASLLRGDAVGALDAVRDPVDVFRLVAAADGPHCADIAVLGFRPLDPAQGFDADVMLHDLARGVTARTLDLDAGDPFDLVVVARRGTGSYRAEVRVQEGERTPRTPPVGYFDEDFGFRAREIVAVPAAGLTPDDVATRADLECVEEGPACLFRAPRDEALCPLLARCARLQAEGLVRYAHPNFLRRLAVTPSDEFYSDQWGIRQTRVDAAWETTTGAVGFRVGIVDSGIRADHPDLQGRIAEGFDFVNGDEDPHDPTARISHGTQTAGVVAAAGNNGIGVAGVLWDARVIVARSFGTSGFGDTLDIANGIRFCAGLESLAGNPPAQGAQVINMSFASSIPTQAERDACAAAFGVGVFLCAATGNQGTATPQFPADYPTVVGVGATTINGTVAVYSNFGTWVDIVAPGGTRGDGVRTTGIDTNNALSFPFVDGTSFASPHVAGVAALVLSLTPMAPDALAQLLFDTAQDIREPGYDIRSGHGIVDAHRAVLAAVGQEPGILIPGQQICVRLLQSPGREFVAETKTTVAEGLRFSFAGIQPGEYILEAGDDRDFDGEVGGPGDVGGVYQDEGGGTILVIEEGGAPVPGLDVPISIQGP